jgi:hypothetical protein
MRAEGGGSYLCAGKKFIENLHAFRDHKLLNLRREDSPEDVDKPEMDCSLKQCCRDMVNQGKLSKKNEEAAR